MKMPDVGADGAFGGVGGPGSGAVALAAPGVPPRSGGERSEPQRRGGTPGAAPPIPTEEEELESPEVSVRKPRKRLTAAYKLEVLRRADACKDHRGELGALLRREGLYSSHLVGWRRQREAGTLGALSGRKRGRKTKAVDPQNRRVIELERENIRLEKRLERANAIISFQKKISELMGIPLSLPGDGEND